MDFYYRKVEVTDFSSIQESGLHVLDVYRKGKLLEGNYSTRATCNVRSATELHEAGIRFDKSKSNGFRDISFNDGVLRLPFIQIDDTSETILLNLIVFEQLHGTGNEVTAYVLFMDGLINSAKDVALLREKGIIMGWVGSDDNIATLFDCLTKDVTLVGMKDGVDVAEELNEYYSKRWHEWRASFMHTYLKNPWVFISLLAAFILLLLTVVQTVYSMLQYYSS